MSSNGQIIDCRDEVQALCETLHLEYGLVQKIVITPREAQAIVFLRGPSGRVLTEVNGEPTTQLVTLRIST